MSREQQTDLTQDQVRELAEALEGQCAHGVEYFLVECFELEDHTLSHKDAVALDEIVFECELCGWWCPVEQMHETNQCYDCTPNETDGEYDG